MTFVCIKLKSIFYQLKINNISTGYSRQMRTQDFSIGEGLEK